MAFLVHPRVFSSCKVVCLHSHQCIYISHWIFLYSLGFNRVLPTFPRFCVNQVLFSTLCTVTLFPCLYQTGSHVILSLNKQGEDRTRNKAGNIKPKYHREDPDFSSNDLQSHDCGLLVLLIHFTILHTHHMVNSPL